jgi:prepilin-type N-terminal cleavage/methylation domain-containing protein
MKREAGFTLIELLITMLIMGVVLAATSDMFVGMLRGYKQQSKITETNIEGIISLEMLRRDIESAGYGLPWGPSPMPAYQEAVNATAATYNDSPTSSPPRAILSGLNADGSAYLVIKAMNLARNAACSKWALLPTSGVLPSMWSSSTSTSENLRTTDRVVLMSPGSDDTNRRRLVDYGLYSAISTEFSVAETRIIYGVDSDTDLRMPFNRADFYLSTTVSLPGRCAAGTKVLVKSTINQNGGGLNTVPLLDCVADMQVVTYLDMNNDGTWDFQSKGLNAADAAAIRNQLKEIHVYILAHEGQRDASYTYAPGTIRVGESAVLGRDFDLTVIPNWQNYRWKIYTLVVRPNSLR